MGVWEIERGGKQSKLEEDLWEKNMYLDLEEFRWKICDVSQEEMLSRSSWRLAISVENEIGLKIKISSA